MGRFASDSGGGNFTPAPAGTHVARLFKIVDLGTQHDEYQGKPSIRQRVVFYWELPNEMVETDDGMRPAIAMQWYTNSLNEKANLRADLEAWRGKGFDESELKAFDLASMLGQPCMLTIVANGDKTSIGAVSGLPKGMTCPAQVNPSYAFWIDNFKPDELENLGGLKKWVEKSEEYKKLSNGAASIKTPPARPAAAKVGTATAKMAWETYKAKHHDEDIMKVAEQWKKAVAGRFAGKPKELITGEDWFKFIEDDFGEAAPELDPVGTFSDDPNDPNFVPF